MLRATADQITRPDAPPGCMLILAAPAGAVENQAVREFLAGLRHGMLAEIRDRLARGVTDGDLAASPAALDAIARYYATVVQGMSVQARDGASDHHLRDGRLGHARPGRCSSADTGVTCGYAISSQTVVAMPPSTGITAPVT
jgi:hypothetical protein